ncbi:hypothetical protein [[Kitasatospora] papulosa]|uniref:hypothetical protein n=1 Tax=[Kitasatospora] papulosa TaxID=1464011 RepID=UPI00403CEFAB
MIHLQVRSEDGTIAARAKHGVVWGPELAELDQSAFPMETGDVPDTPGVARGVVPEVEKPIGLSRFCSTWPAK